MKTEKTKRLSLPEFLKKYKKEHPEFTGKRTTQKIRAEYKKYLVKFKRDKKKADKEEKAFLKFDKEMIAKEKAIEKEDKEIEED